MAKKAKKVKKARGQSPVKFPESAKRMAEVIDFFGHGSNDQTAEALGVSGPYISDLKLGKKQPGPVLAKTIEIKSNGTFLAAWLRPDKAIIFS